MKKITKATFKSFINKNRENLFINVLRRFDGMTDGCENCNDGFRKAEKEKNHAEYTMNVSGLWLVGSSRDYFTAFENETYKGFEYSNCCGCGIVAIKK